MPGEHLWSCPSQLGVDMGDPNDVVPRGVEPSWQSQGKLATPRSQSGVGGLRSLADHHLGLGRLCAHGKLWRGGRGYGGQSEAKD